MFSLWSCGRHTSILVSLSLSVAGKHLPCSSLSISSKHFLNFPKLNPSARTMSAPSRSVFDVLMANASKKKDSSQSQSAKPKGSSPRKRKSPSKSQTPNLLPHNGDTPAPSSGHQETVEKSSSSGIGDANMENSMNNGSKDSATKQGKTSNEDTVKGAKKPKVSISPEESVSELKKKAADFKVKRAAYWGEGKRVPFMFVAKALDAVSKESGRIVITGIVCNMMRTVMETSPDDLLAVMYLLVNRIAPAHEGLELGIGESSIIKALAEACGAKEAHIKKQYEVITAEVSHMIHLCVLLNFVLPKLSQLNY